METREFGTRLRELRKQAGLSQRELADKIGVNFTYLSKIESGVMPPPSEKVIMRLAEVLNADRDELMTLAGKIPSDIAQILRNRETLQLLRLRHARQKSGTTNLKEGICLMKRLSKVAIPIILVCAVGASLWFASPLPVKALNISFPSLPTSGIMGTTYSCQVKVSIENTELLPIQSIGIKIYNVANSSYYDQYAGLPLGTTSGYILYSTTGVGTSASIKATADANWGYVYGYGYAVWQGQGYSFFPPTGYGYGYGYKSGVGTTSITYDINWVPPSAWPEGQYIVQATVTTESKTFNQSSSGIAIYAAVVPAGGGLAPVTTLITSEGKFTQDVTVTSPDAKASFTIKTGTIALVKGRAVSEGEIRIIKMLYPPEQPKDSSIMGLVYDLIPDGTTFKPAITLTLAYDPSLIPSSVDERRLVIAYYDQEAGKWVNLTSTVDTTTHIITAQVSHSAAFTVIAYTRPAAFTISGLTILPSEVNRGDSVTISVLAANTGDLSGSLKVTLKINDKVEATQDVTLTGGASQKVTFTTTKSDVGTYTIAIDGQSGTFTVTQPPTPATFTLSALTISPTELNIGGKVTIGVLVTNTGNLTGSRRVTLKINDKVEATQDVTLAGSASQRVTFITSKSSAGTYAINVDGQSGTFTVKAPVVPPTPVKAVTWPLYVGIIVGVILIGAVIWFILRRRAES